MTDHGLTDTDDVSVAHEVLSAPVRRATLCDLRDRESEQVSLDALVASLTDQLPEADAQSLQSLLHHTHLPKLDDAGVVDYRPDGETIRYVGDPTVEQLLGAGRDG